MAMSGKADTKQRSRQNTARPRRRVCRLQEVLTATEAVHTKREHTTAVMQEARSKPDNWAAVNPLQHEAKETRD